MPRIKYAPLFILTIVIYNSIAYKPVFLLHGIMSGDDSMDLIKSIIIEKHPGTVVHNHNAFGGWSSLDNMWYQAQQIKNDLMNFTATYPGGIHLLGYSQGALLARAVLQISPDHEVQHFISLSGPQAGQYGTEFLHIIFPDIALKTAYELFYSRIGQHTSVGNYWNDPYHQELFYSYSQFLPYVNNEILTNYSSQFKQSLLKLKKLVLFGGPDDNVITPWQSSQFGYYDDNMTIRELTEREIYTKDTIGLRTLHEKKRLETVTIPGVNHYMWHLNASLIENFIIKYLD